MRANCSGQAARCSARCDIADRVVSLPAKIISRKKLVNSASVRRSPSTSDSMSLVIRSSAGSGATSFAEVAGVGEDAVRSRRVERQQAQLGRVAVGRRVEGLRGRARHQVIGQLDHEVVVLGRDAHDVADDPDGDGLGDRRHPVPAAVANEAVEAVDDPGPDGVGVALHVTWRERCADEAAQTGVDGRVEIDHRGPGVERVGVDVVDLDVAHRGGIGTRIARHLDQVGVAGHRPEATVVAGARRVPRQPGPCPELGEDVMGDAVGVQVRIGQIGGGCVACGRVGHGGQPNTNGSRVRPSISIQVVRVRRNASSASRPLSRPWPDCFMPPNGATQLTLR